MTTQAGAANPPPQLRRPKAGASPKEWDTYLRQLEWIIFQLWNRTGGGDDTVDDTVNSQVDTDGLFGLFSRVSDLEFRNVVSVTSDYTTIGADIVICNDAVTVSLNDEPEDQELVTIKRAAGKVKISGNGKLVDGSAQVNVILKYTSLDIIYTVDTDTWNII
jgi:hypothetical protein